MVHVEQGIILAKLVEVHCTELRAVESNVIRREVAMGRGRLAGRQRAAARFDTCKDGGKKGRRFWIHVNLDD
jgi:hypothetical protein